MRITIEIDPAPDKAEAMASAVRAIVGPEAPADSATDGGAAPGAEAAMGGTESDGAGPSDELLAAVAAAEAAGTAAPAADATDAGAAPSL
jgi:hypothetical protein